MATTLKCDRCGKDYSDERSTRIAKDFQEKWEALCRLEGTICRGIAPCAMVPCDGELILTEEGG